MGLTPDEQYNREAARQLRYSQEAIGWKVQDAKMAGIHPLYALGAQTHQPSPIYAGGDQGQAPGGGNMGFMGQSYRPKDTLSPEQKTQQVLQTTRMQLENYKLSKEISLMGQEPDIKPGIFQDPVKYTTRTVRDIVSDVVKNAKLVGESAMGYRSIYKSGARPSYYKPREKVKLGEYYPSPYPKNVR